MTNTKKQRRRGYAYNINGTTVRSSRKIYMVNGVPSYRKGDFFQPVGPQKHFEIMRALLPIDNN